MTLLYGLTVDTEEAWDWRAGWPVTSHFVDYLVDVVPRLESLCSGLGVRTTLFVNEQVLIHPVAREVVLAASRVDGIEIGMHIHPWQTPPFEGTLEGTERGSFLASYPRAIVRAKLQTVLGVFQDCGLRPTSFRGGRYSTSPEIQEFLLEHGFIADCSIVPYTSWPDQGSPDYRDRSNEPRPVRGENGRLWEIPLTVGFSSPDFDRWAARLDRLGSGPLAAFHLEGLLDRIGIVRRLWLNFDDSPFECIMKLVDESVSRRHDFLVLTVHSSSLFEGGNPYSMSASSVEQIWDTLRQSLESIGAMSGLEPATITEIASELEVRN